MSSVRWALWTSAVALATSQALATVVMGIPFGSHMVLQRDAPVSVWGTAAAGESVSVNFSSQTKTVKTLANGTWKVTLAAMEAGGPYTLVAKGTSNTVSYSDVMVGEVWQCAGQSNMDTRLNYWEYPNLADSIKTANYPNLRYLTMRQPGQTVQWQQVTPTTAGALSAAGYFFGRDLLAHLNGVAVGLVVTAVGGTIIEQWMDSLTVASDASLQKDTSSGGMYKAWVRPVAGYGIKGTIWLQGENNTSSALYRNYAKRLQQLVPAWRRAWGMADMPFLVAGLCHKGVKQVAVGETSNEASIREAQRTVTDTLAGTWLSALVDLGADSTWHYPQKPELGRRLGKLARGAIYRQTGFVYEHPRPTGCFLRGSTIVIPFDARGDHLTLDSGTVPLGFAVAGADGKWSWATTSIQKDTVFLTTSLATPTQVEYAWANQPIGNLRGASGLPATPFRLTIASGGSVGLAAPGEVAEMPQLSLRQWGDRLEVEAPSTVRTCEVFDLAGRRRLSLHPGTAVFDVDFAGLSSGLWILRASWDGASSQALFRR